MLWQCIVLAHTQSARNELVIYGQSRDGIVTNMNIRQGNEQHVDVTLALHITTRILF